MAPLIGDRVALAGGRLAGITPGTGRERIAFHSTTSGGRVRVAPGDAGLGFLDVPLDRPALAHRRGLLRRRRDLVPGAAVRDDRAAGPPRGEAFASLRVKGSDDAGSTLDQTTVRARELKG